MKPMNEIEKFEETLKRLEELTSELEAGNLSLADSLSKFEEAVKCFRLCHKLLKEAEGKVEALIKDAEGNIIGTEPFETTE